MKRKKSSNIEESRDPEIDSLNKFKQRFLEMVEAGRPLYGVTEKAQEYLKMSKEFQVTLSEYLKNRLIDNKYLDKLHLSIASEGTLEKLKNDAEAQEGLYMELGRLILNGQPFPKRILNLVSSHTLQEIKSNESLQDAILQRLTSCLQYFSDKLRDYEEYMHLASRDTLERLFTIEGTKDVFIKHVTKLIALGYDIPQLYISFLDKDSFQDVLRKGLTIMFESNFTEMPEEYFNLVTKETLQSALQAGLTRQVSFGWVIEQKYLDIADQETLQFALQEGVISLIEGGRQIPQQYLDLISEIFSEYLISDRFQSALCDGLIILIESRKDIPQQYIELATEEVTKQAFQKGVIKLMDMGVRIPDEYLAWCNKDFQLILQDYFIEYIELGQRINPVYANLATLDTISNLQSPEVVKETAFNMIQFFFGGSELTAKATREVIESLNVAERHRMLFDKTLLPVGIKIHTSANTTLAETMQRTGGFVAHDQDTCYVSHPVPNTTFLRVCMEVLNKIGVPVVSEYKDDQEQMYIQVTTSERLNNHLCGVATFAFLFSNSQILDLGDLGSSWLKGLRLTIYDAGVVDNNFFTPTHSGEQPRFKGRTDILMAFSMSDIENANLIMSLLVASQDKRDDMILHDVGVDFVKELEQLLEDYKLKRLLDADFVYDDYRPVSEQPIQSVLQEISIMRQGDAEIIEGLREISDRLNNYDVYDVADPRYYEDREKQELLEQYKILQEKQSNLLSTRMAKLLQKYRERVYENGYLNDFNTNSKG